MICEQKSVQIQLPDLQSFDNEAGGGMHEGSFLRGLNAVQSQECGFHVMCPDLGSRPSSEPELEQREVLLRKSRSRARLASHDW